MRSMGTIMFSVLRLSQSNVSPHRLSSSRASSPRFRVVISCQVMVGDTALGVPTWLTRDPLPPIQVVRPVPMVGTYRLLGTVWSPMVPQEPRNLSRLRTCWVPAMKSSSVNTHPAEKEGNHRHFKSAGNFEEPS